MEGLFDSLSVASVATMEMALNALLPGCIVTVAAAITLRMLPRLNARTRCAVWWAVLVLVAALPLAWLAAEYWPQSVTMPATSTAQIDVRETEPILVQATESEGGSLPTRAATADREPARRVLMPARQTSPEPLSYWSIAGGLFIIWLLALWIFGAFVQLAGLGAAYVRIAAIKRRSRPLPADLVDRLIDRLRLWRRPRQVKLAESDDVSVPTMAGLTRPHILVPVHLVRDLRHDELDAVLLHELAHVARYDDWRKLVQQIVRAVLFIHPAVHFISRQIDRQREIACDDMVVACIRHPESYARCLTRILQMTDWSRTAVAPLTMVTRSHIYARFSRLLSRDRLDDTHFSRPGFAVMFVAVLAVAVASVVMVPSVGLSSAVLTYEDLSAAFAPGQQPVTAEPPAKSLVHPVAADLLDQVAISEATGEEVPQLESGVAESDPVTGESVESEPGTDEPPMFARDDDQPAEDDEGALTRGLKAIGRGFSGGFRGLSVLTDDDRVQTIRWSDGRREISVAKYGDIEFNDNDDRIERMSDDGFFALRERRGRDKWEVEIEPGGSGDLNYSFYHNGRHHDDDTEAREWLAGALIEAVRQTGVGAKARVRRIYGSDGVDGVLAETQLIESDYVRRRYLGELTEAAELSEEELAKVLEFAAREMESDYERSELLISMADDVHRRPELMEHVLAVALAMESDYETRRVLTSLGVSKQASPEIVRGVLEVAGKMNSDYERAELLIDIAPYCSDDAELGATYVEAVSAIDSDYETRRVLSQLGDYRGLTEETIGAILEMTQYIDSDYEKSELLIELSRRTRENPELKLKYVRAVATLDSDYEARRALSAMYVDGDDSPELISAILEAVDRIDSDYERAEFLIALVPDVRESLPVSRFLLLAGDLRSDYETSRVLSALLNHVKLEDEDVVGLLGVVDGMASDYEKGNLLDQVGPRCMGNEALENEFLDVVDGISSEYDRDRIYARFFRGKRQYQ